MSATVTPITARLFPRSGRVGRARGPLSGPLVKRVSCLLALCWLGFVGTSVSARAQGATDAYRVSIEIGESIHQLGSDDLFESEPAQSLLIALGPVVIPSLRVALEKEDEAIRLGVIEVLASIEVEGSTVLLAETARTDPSLEARGNAIVALVSRGAPQAQELVALSLQSDEPALYRSATLGCPTLCPAASQLDRLVELIFLEPITYMDGPRAALLRAIDTDSRREQATLALKRGAMARLHDDDLEIRLRAGILLSDIRDPSALEPLSLVLDHDLPVLFRARALLLLGEQGDRVVAKKMGAALGSLSTPLRTLACRALSRMAEREVVGAKEEFASHDCPTPK